MLETLNTLEPLLRTFWLIAIPTSLFFTLQTIATFFGADADSDIDTDFDMDGDTGGDLDFHVFSLRNLINFLLGFSWTGISFWDTIANKGILILLSVIVGILFVALFFVIIKQIMKLAEDNSFKVAETLHKSGEVYLTIPANKEGKGQILISVRGSMHQLQAMTEKDEKLASGTLVKVVRIENENILIVEKI